jgi:hypothetical protein
MAPEQTLALVPLVEQLAPLCREAYSWSDGKELLRTLVKWHRQNRSNLGPILADIDALPPIKGRASPFERWVLWREPRLSIALHRWQPNPSALQAQLEVDVHNHTMPAASLLLRGQLQHRVFGTPHLKQALDAWVKGDRAVPGQVAHRVLSAGDVYFLPAEGFHHMTACEPAAVNYTLFLSGPPVYAANVHVSMVGGKVRLHLPRRLEADVVATRTLAGRLAAAQAEERLLSTITGAITPDDLNELVYVG